MGRSLVWWLVDVSALVMGIVCVAALAMGIVRAVALARVDLSQGKVRA